MSGKCYYCGISQPSNKLKKSGKHLCCFVCAKTVIQTRAKKCLCGAYPAAAVCHNSECEGKIEITCDTCQTFSVFGYDLEATIGNWNAIVGAFKEARGAGLMSNLKVVICHNCASEVDVEESETWRGDVLCFNCLESTAENEVYRCICDKAPIIDIWGIRVYCANENCDVPHVEEATIEKCVEKWNQQIIKLEKQKEQ